jgi:hypothetical protein
MFGFSVQSREIGVVILQHFVLITVAKLASERTVLGTPLGVGVQRVVFHCALAKPFVWTGRYGVGHGGSPMVGGNGLIVAPGRVGWLAPPTEMRLNFLE